MHEDFTFYNEIDAGKNMNVFFNRWWRIEMHRGVELAYLFGTITLPEKIKLDRSIDEPINERRMNRDTNRRLGRKG